MALSLAGCAMVDGAAVESDEPEAAAAEPVSIAETCEVLKRLLAAGREEIEASRGSLLSVDPPPVEGMPGGTTYASRLQVPGWSDCTIFSEDMDDDPYTDHALYCFSLELPRTQAAMTYVDDIYRCTRNIFSERRITEAWLDGRYDMVAFEGEITPAGRDTPVDYGSESYATLSVEADDPQIVSVTINFQFLTIPDTSAEEVEERIILR